MKVKHSSSAVSNLTAAHAQSRSDEHEPAPQAAARWTDAASEALSVHDFGHRCVCACGGSCVVALSAAILRVVQRGGDCHDAGLRRVRHERTTRLHDATFAQAGHYNELCRC